MKSTRVQFIKATGVIALVAALVYAAEVTITSITELNNPQTDACGVYLSIPGYLTVNDNDDNGDELWDKLNSPCPGDENDLKPVTLTATAGKVGGTLKLLILGGDKIASQSENMAGVVLWKDNTKTTPETERSWDVLPNQTLPAKTFWIEGNMHSNSPYDVQLYAIFESPGGRGEDGKDYYPCSASTLQSTTVYRDDLDVDSENNNNFDFDGFTKDEDQKETSEKLTDGKRSNKILIATSNGNTDSDDLYDYADGFNLEKISELTNTYYPSLKSTKSAKKPLSEATSIGANLKFIPVMVRLKEPFTANGAKVKIAYSPVSKPEISDEGLKKVGTGSKTDPYRILVNKGGMRIWNKNPQKRKSGKPVPAGDFVPADTELAWNDIATADKGDYTGDDDDKNAGVAKLYLEYLDTEPATASGIKEIKVTITEKIEGIDVVATDIVKVILCPANVIAYKHAKCGTAGAVIAQNFGNYGYETTVIENGDDDIEPDGESADYDKNNTTANMDKDDDFVKITFKLSKEARIPGATVKLEHKAVKIDGKRDTMGKYQVAVGSGKRKNTRDVEVIEEMSGLSNLRFYDNNGNRLSDADLTIADMSNPGDGYFAKLITDGEVSIWAEGNSMFGQTVSRQPGQDEMAADSAKMGGARVSLMVEQNGIKNDAATLLVYRGGYFAFRQKLGQPGTLANIEFYDGKGRVNCIGTGKTDGIFVVDEYDVGNLIWNGRACRAGRMKDGSQGLCGTGSIPGGEFWERNKLGHTPPGWWYVSDLMLPNDTWNPSLRDNESANLYSGDSKCLFQGAYVRWEMDDPFSYDSTGNLRPDVDIMTYIKQYLYQPNKQYGYDRQIGSPENREVCFKANMHVIPGGSFFNREAIQIHPDGWRDGTGGCIGIQAMSDVVKIKGSW